MQPDRNPAAQLRPTAKRCPDCGEPQPTSAFYDRGDGQLSTYCKHHQRERSRASYCRHTYVLPRCVAVQVFRIPVQNRSAQPFHHHYWDLPGTGNVLQLVPQPLACRQLADRNLAGGGR